MDVVVLGERERTRTVRTESSSGRRKKAQYIKQRERESTQGFADGLNWVTDWRGRELHSKWMWEKHFAEIWWACNWIQQTLANERRAFLRSAWCLMQNRVVLSQPSGERASERVLSFPIKMHTNCRRALFSSVLELRGTQLLHLDKKKLAQSKKSPILSLPREVSSLSRNKCKWEPIFLLRPFCAAILLKSMRIFHAFWLRLKTQPLTQQEFGFFFAGGSTRWRPSACSWPTRLSTPRIFSSSAATTSAPALTGM